MFWLGFIIGWIITTIAIAGVMAFCCKMSFGDKETFDSMVDVVIAAGENRESVVKVFHNGEELEASATFKQL